MAMVSFTICLHLNEIILEMEWGKVGHTWSVEAASFNT